MKKVIFLLLAISLTIVSCKKNDDNTEEPEASAGSGKITLKLDNGNFVDFPIDNASSMGGKIYLNGVNGDNTLTIVVKDPSIGAGNYTTNDFGIVYGENSINVFDSVNNTSNEEFVVTEHNQSSHHISGTYQLTFTDNNTGNTRYAEGTFDVTYIVL
jgi:hypothetical protein